MICVYIDELTPCLKDILTGDFVETEVIRLRRKSFLQKFTKKSGWYTNWANELDKNEVYALVIKGTVDIQGLISLRKEPDYNAVYISWAVAAPHNNPEISDPKKYSGVGGHLLAIAINKSVEYNYHGDVTGFCRNNDIMNHFVREHGAVPICMLHDYQIGIYDDAAMHIKEVYTYEWSDDEL